MKRGLTLAGSIIGTVFSALSTLGAFLLVLGAFGLASLGGTVEEPEIAGAMVIVGGIYALALAFSVTCLDLNAICIKGYKADPEKYHRLRGTIIAAIVFNFLVVVSQIYSLFTTVGAFNIAIGVLVLLALVAANVFMIVDLCLEKKRLQANTITTTEATNVNQNQQ